jgi:hypothetical protein
MVFMANRDIGTRPIAPQPKAATEGTAALSTIITAATLVLILAAIAMFEFTAARVLSRVAARVWRRISREFQRANTLNAGSQLHCDSQPKGQG